MIEKKKPEDDNTGCYVVLNDGETYTRIDDCQVVWVRNPVDDDAVGEAIKWAYGSGDSVPVIDLTLMAAGYLSVSPAIVAKLCNLRLHSKVHEHLVDGLR